MTQLLPSFKSVSFPRKIRGSSHICYFMPMGSQQTTISTCLHLSLRPLQNLDMADVINVNVTYNKTKRIISYQKDGDVQGFCHLFLHVFSDVLPSKVTPIQVKFLQCDDKMGPEDYQELQNNDKLDDKKRLRAFIWKEEEIVKVKIPRRSSIDIEIVNAKIRQIEILLWCFSYIYVFFIFLPMRAQNPELLM